MNYYEHHLGDYAKDAGHLSMIEDGAYRRLLDAYYVREKALPADVRECCKLSRATTKPERDAVAYVLSEFFVLQADGHHQRRADAEVARFQDKQRKASASAKARWSQRQAEFDRNADAMRTHSEGNAPRARSQTPDTSSEPKGSGGPGGQPDSADTIFGLGVPLLTACNVSERNARSMLGLMRKTHSDQDVIDALQRCVTEKPMQPVPWLQNALKAKQAAGTPRKSKALMDGNIAVMQRFLDGVEQ